jgi:hypothetical protein
VLYSDFTDLEGARAMQMFWRSLLVTVLALTLSSAGMVTAGAATRVLDSYCSPSGDYCTLVVKKDGTIVLKIRAFADYFGTVKTCVTKETRVCRNRSAREGAHGIHTWSIRWQGNYPREGSGRYTVRWLDESGERIGPKLHFRRG